MEKCCFGIDKIEDVFVTFSENVEFMSVYVIVKRRSEILSMSDCTSITAGMKTERFDFYFKKKTVLDEDHCFSISFPGRSYDFVTKSKKQRDRIVNNLNFLRDCYEDKEN